MTDQNSIEPVRDAESIERLKKLREKLMSEDISTARKAAYNLSWLQEDGLTLLKEALFGDYSRTVKKAAGYGLRNMKGRMKKLAAEALQEGLNHQDRTIQAVSEKAIELMQSGGKSKPAPDRKRSQSKRKIREAPPRSGNVKESFNTKKRPTRRY